MKSLACLTATVAIAIGGVAPATAEPPPTPIPSCETRSADTLYFPAGTFRSGYPDPAQADAFTRAWYSKHLAAMTEPSLSCGETRADETYRFLWLRSFDNPIAVRVWRSGDTAKLEAVILDGAGGYDPGTVKQRLEVSLTPDQWNTVKAALDKLNFWVLPTDSSGPPGLDGAQWIIEGRSDYYHVVDRWSGGDGVEAVGRLFLDHAGLKIPPDDVY